MNKRGYLSRIGTIISQTLNVILFNGDPDESISARAYRRTQEGSVKWARVVRVIDAIFFFEPGHCRRAYQTDLSHALFIIRSKPL